MKCFGQRHLGGFVRADAEHPVGDPDSYCEELWFWLCDILKVKSVLDIGCGQGHSCKWFQEHGLDCTGIDGLVEANKRGLIRNFVLHDYTRGPLLVMPMDFGWCCEFVEHVEEKYVGNFLETFRCCNAIAMTHALPGQKGWHHVNCQSAEYWIDKMKQIGFVLDRHLTRESKEHVEQQSYWFKSGMIFRMLHNTWV